MSMPGYGGYGLSDVLDNTPWWLEDSRKGSGHLGRCDPFGHESGDVRVLGGMSDPNRELHTWMCQNNADARYRMTCANGHTGQILRLCYAHAYQITRRMGGLCPRCAWPPRAKELDETMTWIMRQLRTERNAEERRRLLRRLEDGRAEMGDLMARGVISTGAPLRLEEIS